jgi:adenylate cyclase
VRRALGIGSGRHVSGPDAFARAFVREILESERLRVRVLAATLAAILACVLVAMTISADVVRNMSGGRLRPWMPLAIIGPFILYDIGVSLLLSRFIARRREPPIVARFANAAIETSLPTVILLVVTRFVSPEVVFGSWPPLLYFLYIVASTLRLDFALSVFTSAVAAAGYLGVAFAVFPIAESSPDPFRQPVYHFGRALIMMAGGVVAGLVAVRLRRTFARVVAESDARERVTNLFGQHVSPAVVDRLLASPVEPRGELRTVCVMFLDIRDFTAQSRTQPPAQVVAYLNDVFAFMIDAIDRHGGIINKFLGDGFMAIFGAPLDDPQAARNAVHASREILAELDRRHPALGTWPLRIGIGLHVGEAVTGNVGSPRRKEFTVMGDTVNLASRLEQLNKEHGTRLVLSDAVVTALGPEAGAVVPLGAVAVRGYADPVRVWHLEA